MNYPSRPSGPVICKANYFKFETTAKIFKYNVKFSPEITENQMKFFMRLVNKLRAPLTEKFKFFYPQNGIIYSPECLNEDLILQTEEEGKHYEMSITLGGILEIGQDKESLNFFGRFFKILQHKLKLQQIGRKYFDPKEGTTFKDLRLEVWPGFSTSLNNYGTNFLVNVDTSYKILREDSAFDVIQEIRRVNTDNNMIETALTNTTVMTKYNKRMYRITGVDFSQSPLSSFETSQGISKTFVDYYLEKYNIKISDCKQPLLIHTDRKSLRKLYLIPELCSVTGLSDAQRNDFNLMKKLAQITKPDAQKRLGEAGKLIDLFYRNPETKSLMENWNIKISKECEQVPSDKLQAGNMVMGKQGNNGARNEFDLENTPDLDRKSQVIMFTQPGLSKWAIFCPDRDRDTCSTFLKTLKECVDTFNYPMQPPREVFIRGNRFSDWESEMRILDESVDAAVFLLSGPKKNGQFYNDIKKLLIKDRPVPSQVVLLKTIQAGRGLRSICNKILIQICAKVGGIPWTINNFPFSDRPTMLVGIDPYQKNMGGGKKVNILAFCATMDRNFSKYWTTVRIQDFGQETGTQLQSCMTQALAEFKEANKIEVENIIFFRDGVSDSQRKAIEDLEVSALRQVTGGRKMIFICVNKRINARFYVGDNLKPNQPLSNPPAGTLIQSKVCGEKEFYLISQKTLQGTASPSHFYILVNDFNNGKEKIQLLCYKLCYMYYNWVGSIKIPAPIQYAQKLSNLIGDKFGNVKPNEMYGKRKSLYFI